VGWYRVFERVQDVITCVKGSDGALNGNAGCLDLCGAGDDCDLREITSDQAQDYFGCALAWAGNMDEAEWGRQP